MLQRMLNDRSDLLLELYHLLLLAVRKGGSDLDLNYSWLAESSWIAIATDRAELTTEQVISACPLPRQLLDA